MPDKVKEMFLVKNEGVDYEISKFLHFHPGGTNLLAPFKNLDIGNKLTQYYHSSAAMYLMKEYKLDDTKSPSNEPQDLEDLVDWSKPMLEQVGLLGDKYYDWMTSPVDRKMRLFKYNFLEYFVYTTWYLIPIVWLPVTAAFTYHGYYYQNQGNISTTTVMYAVLGGCFASTLIEYCLHRWLFHRKPCLKSPRQITFHFLLHGLHHKIPFDEHRLLFPPLPASIIFIILYMAYTLLLPSWLPSFFLAGTIVGYVAYDLTHYYLHFGSPKPGSYMYHLKRYHNKHHYTHQDSAFGVTSVVWDGVFGTKVSLTKLKQALKWRLD